MILPKHVIDGYHQPLAGQGCLPDAVHVFDQDSCDAIEAALAARRPLLVRGEPGTGKSQLARAAAAALDRALVTTTADARTETRDLLWSFDAVARLAEAQVLGGLRRISRAAAKERVAVRRFVQPGALWWAFDWEEADKQARIGGPGSCKKIQPPGWSPDHGCVLLIDEIDKADASVPNGLLDALGHGSFETPWEAVVSMSVDVPPLVVITTNEERTLPDAFVRRCFVLQLDLDIEGPALRDRLLQCGRAHFDDLHEDVLGEAATLLGKNRKDVYDRGLNPPGVAEYIDLLRAVREQRKTTKDRIALLGRIGKFVLQKHARERKA